GIDHSAIVISNTENSLKFYRDYLGFKVIGESENYGIEQEKLSNVPGARLRITGLHAEEGPGIELLEYLTPTTGRSIPKDTTPFDLWRWQIHLMTQEPAAFKQKVPFILTDPDGHALLISD
ncbi:MAG: VOC family protein, partial [Anaerolineae bacterium]